MSARQKLTIPEIELSQRTSQRHILRLRVSDTDARSETPEIVVYDLSAGGFSFSSPKTLSVGMILTADLPEAGEVNGSIKWASDGRYGCQFDRPLNTAELAAARLKSQPTLVPISPVDVIESTPEPAIEQWSMSTRGAIWLAGATFPWIIGGALLLGI